ncbi:MAG: DitF protein [Actinobacteria bacterium]|nr:MAG: DitF protein [Actinomycetota bacterium]
MDTLPSAKQVFVRASAQTPYSKRPPAGTTTTSVLADAFAALLESSGLAIRDIDGLAVSSFTLTPDRAIDLAVKFGLKLSWIMDGGTGGASGVDMTQHAMRAVEAGDAKNIAVLGGDVFRDADFTRLVENYNRNTQELLTPIGVQGPNPLFALLTQTQMKELGLTKEDYGRLVIHQRKMAAANPNALYRELLSMDEYLSAPMVATPLGMFDCVPVASGANAVLISDTPGDVPIAIRKISVAHNYDLHEGDGTATGLSAISHDLFKEMNKDTIDVVALYDDYPVIVIAQLADLGFISWSNASEDLQKILSSGQPLINSSGGQLSSGQCGAGAGLHGMVEVVNALRATSAKRGLVTGYGMVAYRYGACANAMLLEAIK